MLACKYIHEKKCSHPEVFMLNVAYALFGKERNISEELRDFQKHNGGP